MNIAVTGAAGFIGSHLVKVLKESFEVVAFDILQTEAALKRASFINPLQQQSIHSNFLENLSSKPDLLIHLAAETGISGSLQNPALYFQQNVQGTFNVLEQCRKNGVKYLIYASSSSVYEPNQAVMQENSPHSKQLSFYGTSKRMTELMIENYCKQFGLIAIGLRFFTVYGSWTRSDMAAYKFMTNIDNGMPITLYNEGNVSRDFTHVSDIIQSIQLLTKHITKESEGFHEIFNIGSGAPVSVKEYAQLIAKHLNKELLFESKPLPSNELNSTHSDTSKLERYINYKPKCSLEEGIEEMTNWFKNNRYE